MTGRPTHLDAAGRVQMVDVTRKGVTERWAEAGATLRMSPAAFAAITAGETAKGNVFATARIAGILAAKRTHELIPLCHPLALTAISVDFAADAAASAIHIVAGCRLAGRTGVEMEALTAVAVAALTLYDMAKALDRGMHITDVRLLGKSGGASGDYRAEA